MAENIDDDEEEELKTVRIFINNVDMYQSRAICAAFNESTEDKKLNYEIYGTVNNMKEAKMKIIRKLVSEILYHGSLDYVCDIINCDVIIYDIGSDPSQLTEVEQIIDVILNKIKNKNADHEVNVKYFILISHPLTWAKTKKLNDENIFYEADYRKRCAHPNYLKHKCIEREVNLMEKRTHCKVRTLVVCPGYTYGGMNDIFHYIFKLAFYNKEIIPVVEPSNHILPFLYIEDFARMIKQLVEKFPAPEIRYIFAVEPKFRKINNFTRQIVRSLGSPTRVKKITKSELLKLRNDLFEQRIIDAITTELKISPTYFEAFDFTFTEKSFDNILSDEFRIARGLKPLKILIDGPPCVGKTTVANILRNFYNLIYIPINTLLEDTLQNYEDDIYEAKLFINNLKKEISSEESEPNEESVAYIIETEEYIDNLSNKLKELVDFTENNIGDRFLLTKRTLTDKLKSKICKDNQGYIIDGFPYDYAQANKIFPNESEGDEDNSENGKVDIKPNHVIILDAPNEVLIARAMVFDDETAAKKGYTEDMMGRNIEQYRERNEEDNSLISFFHDINIIPIIICVNARTKIGGIIDMLKHEIGAPHTYPISREEHLQQQEAENEKRMQETQELICAQEELRAKIKAEREARLKIWTKEFEKLKSEEEATIEAKTLPLRYYLSKYVLPTLTEGILKTAELKPDDPVDFLAEYFFKHNSTGHVLPPTYNNELKELLLTEGKDGTTTILKELADNENEFRCSK